MNRLKLLPPILLCLLSILSSCINCEERLNISIKPIKGTVKIDTLYDGDRARMAMNLKTMEEIKIKDYIGFPKKLMVGDSIVKLEGESTYTLYKKDSFYVMGFDCNLRKVVVFSSGLRDELDNISRASSTILL